MSTEHKGTVTRLLERWRRGDEQAEAELFKLAYADLHGIAKGLLRRQQANHTVQTTELIHEAYLKLNQGQEIDCSGRIHFYALMARVMRCWLVDQARHRARVKRGGGAVKTSLDEVAVIGGDPDPNLLDLSEALTKLESVDPRKTAIVEMRYFAGLTLEETAEHLEISVPTVVREWRIARAWLYRELGGELATSAPPGR